MDLRHTPVATEGELLNYCYHAAGVVGLMMCRIMGVNDRRAESPAVALGIAMQLTNIARDVREDSNLGRCYLPGIVDPAEVSENALKLAVDRVLSLAEKYYEKAESGIQFLPRRCRVGIISAANLYREIGHEIRRQGTSVWHGRTVLPVWRVVYVASQSAVTAIPRSISAAPKKESAFSISTYSKGSIMSDSRHTVLLGISLTAFMAAALFAMVYFNPKETVYSFTPLIYSAASILIGIATNFWARQYDKPQAEAMFDSNPTRR